MAAGLCGSSSSMEFISENGTIPLCFLHLVFYGTACALLLAFGAWRFREVRKSPSVEISYTRLQTTKVGLFLLLAALPLLRSIIDLATSQTEFYTLLSGFFISITCVFGMLLMVTEYSRGFRNNWVLRTWWTAYFIISSLELQTNLYLYQYNADFFIAFLNFVVALIMAVIGLFMNRIPEAYERLISANDTDDTISYDRKQSPEVTANIFSKLTFGWLTPLLLLGYKRPLEAHDLYDVRNEYHGKEVGQQFEQMWKEELTKPKPSLVRAFRLAYGRQFYFAGILKLFHDLLLFVGPVILEAIVTYVKSPDAPTSVGFGYVIAMGAASMGQTLLLHQYFFIAYNTGMKVRNAVVTAVYSKAFVLSSKAKRESTQGEIVNLQAVDSSRLQELFPYLHTLWSAPFQMIVSIIMLWRLVGPSVLAGIGVMILTTPVNGVIMKKLLVIQKDMMKSKDARTKIMNEVLNGMRVIKFFAWEQSFTRKILEIRESEMQTIKKTLFLRAVAIFLWSGTPVLVSTVTFSIYSLAGNELTAEVAFTALALFNILRFPLNALPMVISGLVEAKVSFNRLHKFLMSEELDPQAVTHDNDPEYPILISGGSFQWESTQTSPTLADIDLKVPNGKLIAIVGAVGSGKSSLLGAILGEIPKISGKVNVSGSMAYVAQQAWVQNASLKDNILFGRPLNLKKYEEAIRVCELSPDIAILPNGDQTEIGEKGINLSGGQKQRVSIARAVYQDCDVYLFDDCLSAVDAHVGHQIFNNCINGVLKHKTRVLVTHQLQYLSNADLIVVMKGGRVSEVGTYQQLMEAQKEFCMLINTHVKESSESTDQEAKVDNTEKKKEDTKKDAQAGKIVSVEERDTGNVNAKVYKAYMAALGGVSVVIVVLFAFIVESVGRLGGDFWLAYWSSNFELHSIGFYMGIYIALSFLFCIVIYARSLMLNVAGIKSARVMHDDMLHRVLRAPMAFFDTTPIGRILNRFSKDQYTIDDSLIRTLGSFVGMLFQALSVIVVIGVASPFSLTALLPLAFLYRHIQKYYLQSSREMKRLDSITRSPVYAQFSETLNGLTTIRTYGRQYEFNDTNNAKLDLNTSAYYALQVANRWLGVRLEFLGTCIVSLSAAFAVVQRDSIGPGLAGLSISYALQMTGILNWLVRMATEVETSMVSVERVLHYSQLPVEAPAVVPSNRPPASWPTQGAVHFKNVKMRYRTGLDLVLNGVTIDIKPKEKIGVVGRTGAGKSSLMLALFRLVELAEGSITIDNIDISSIGLDDLRSKLSIIPQDPTLFTGSVRSNLDPFNQYSDLDIWQVLEAVHLKVAIEELAQKLESPVTEFGENFSVGQRQLLCLGRALLRRAKILVMDEATASIDFETDSLIQKTIREEFKDVTVLTIAHRINTIMDYDRVMVLDKGQIVECDSPAILSKDAKTIFHSMVHKSGTVIAEDQIAEF